MKKLLLILLFGWTIASAQNYNCLQTGVKHYFINAAGYMRGMRIDSITVSGSDTIYHSFLSNRTGMGTGSYYYRDSAGSWLGKDVTRQADGTFLFFNYFHDTVIVKSLASPGDSWVFYSDSSSVYYTATVASVDTMSVLGTIDSVKKIVINAFDSGRLSVTDSINNFQLLLSQHHGFVQAFDLYTFPYHLPAAIYGSGFDYHLDQAVQSTGAYFPGFQNSEFNIVAYHNPTNLELYNYNVGDAFCNGLITTDVSETQYVQNMYDSILSKTIIDPFHTQYSVYSIWNTTNYAYPMFSAPVITNHVYYGDHTITVDTSLAISFTNMPEEEGFYYSWFYLPADNSRGVISSYYKTRFVPGSGFVEFCLYDFEYKAGFEQIAFDTCSTDITTGFPYTVVTQYQLGYSNKGGVTFGTTCESVLSTKQVVENGLSIFPNPANDDLIINLPIGSNNTITLTNMIGETLVSKYTSNPRDAISVTNLPAGVYQLIITNGNGSRHNEKVVVVH